MEKVIEISTNVLIFDYTIYPRHNIDDFHVALIAEAIRAGKSLPPCVIDSKSKRIVDGWHRIKAHIKIYGTEKKITVIAKKYGDEAELFLDSVKLNAEHGKRLSSYDIARCITKAEEMNIDPSFMAANLGMTVEKLSDLRIKKVAQSDNGPVPIKRALVHFARNGMKLSLSQQEAMKGIGGMSAHYLVGQIIALVEADLIDYSNMSLVKKLRYLASIIEVRVPEPSSGDSVSK